MPWGYDQLNTLRLTETIQTLESELEAPDQLIFVNTTPDVDAEDDEIMASFEGQVVSADIVADDQRAVIRGGGRYNLNTSAIPNIKQGSLVTQAMIKLLRRMSRGAGLRGDATTVENYCRRELSNKLQAIRIMKNRMLAGMRVDDFTYRKMGVEFRNVTWGMPSDLKFVPSVGWDVTSSTPIDDILLYKRYAAENYGEQYDRLTLSTKLFNYMIRSDNFRDFGKLYTPLANPGEPFPVEATRQMRAILEGATETQIRLYDAVYRDEMNDGSIRVRRYIPEEVAFFDNVGNDGDAAVWDFANGVVSESIIGNIPGINIIGGGFPAEARGPIGYASVKGDLNPPNLTIWGVARGFPRKHRASATARITAYTPTYL
jgi:hypothetical protein